MSNKFKSNTFSLILLQTVNENSPIARVSYCSCHYECQLTLDLSSGGPGDLVPTGLPICVIVDNPVSSVDGTSTIDFLFVAEIYICIAKKCMWDLSSLYYNRNLLLLVVIFLSKWHWKNLLVTIVYIVFVIPSGWALVTNLS